MTALGNITHAASCPARRVLTYPSAVHPDQYRIAYCPGCIRCGVEPRPTSTTTTEDQ